MSRNNPYDHDTRGGYTYPSGGGGYHLPYGIPGQTARHGGDVPQAPLHALAAQQAAPAPVEQYMPNRTAYALQGDYMSQLIQGLNDQAAQIAAESEAREARIRGSMAAVTDAFSNRSGLYDNVEHKSFALNKAHLHDDYNDALLGLKFALARSGQLGGSADVDQHAKLSDQYNQSILNAHKYALDQANALRSNDRSLESSLYNIAASGTLGASGIMPQVNAAMAAQPLPSPQLNPQIRVEDTGLGGVFKNLIDSIGRASYGAGFQHGPPQSGSPNAGYTGYTGDTYSTGG